MLLRVPEVLAPAALARCRAIMEAADWVVLQLTGEERRNSCTAGYKAIFEKGVGYPSPDYFAALKAKTASAMVV